MGCGVIATKCGKWVLVDIEDFEKVSKYKWYLSSSGYAIAYSGGRVWMHRFLINPPKNLDVDHINGDKLDNRKSNLRPATRGQNLHSRPKLITNSSGFKGVFFEKSCSKWRAQIHCKGKKFHCGVFKTAEEAARAYDRYALKLFGPFAWLNFKKEY